ncbi:MAG: pilus assembly PilX N-terminal domain-containing protein [Planctomycetota bacterium]|nr:MAG: pilus assembly PilX N-terminal domain-containing protein [Planctomycetota bacterium]
MTRRKYRKGAALLVSMIVLAMLSAWAAAIYSMSGANIQLAENQRKANHARASAESGLEIIRHWVSYVSIPGETPPNQRFPLIASSFLSAANNISGIMPTYDGSSITVPDITLNSAKGQGFNVQIIPLPTSTDPNTLQVDVFGTYGPVTKTLRVNYSFGTRADTAFDYGVATKGPLNLLGNIDLEGVNVSVESDVYIVSENELLALSIIGNSQIAGDVHIANPLGTVNLEGGQASIGGETGQDAIDNHVTFGVAPTEFPVPNPEYFEPYTTNIIDSSIDTSADATFENVRIVAGTNPTFSGHVTLNGVVYIEVPNIVTFTGDVTITGVVAGAGDIEDDSATNQINFLGNVYSNSVSELPPEEQFAGLEEETGTFTIAPGFLVSFGGDFGTLNGAIAGNGIEFFGNAGGLINGSVINYSDLTMDLTGNSDLLFNRSGTTEIPAGFIPEIVLNYEPISYSEVVL